MSRVAVITGATGGIGRATAQLFHRQGWYVVGIDQIQAAETAIDCYISADVATVAAWENIAHSLERVDVLINNAAVQICKPLVETTPEEWDSVMAVNLRSVYLGVKYLQPLMSRDGAIVNVSSVHAIATSQSIAAYAASKGGMLALTRALALELAPIRVNAILPGAVDTAMLRAGLSRGHLQGGNSDELVEDLGKKHPTGRIGQPTEIAEAIYFLADSQKSGFMTGQGLVVDGGATARLSTE